AGDRRRRRTPRTALRAPGRREAHGDALARHRDDARQRRSDVGEGRADRSVRRQSASIVRKIGIDPGLPRFFCLALLAATAALAQPYPAKPVTFIVPFSPGGGTDISARTLAAKLTAKWGHAVVVENRAGAAGILGADAVARARPDGYTLLIAN